MSAARYFSVLVVVCAPLGCAETEVRGRDVFRVAPLRDRAVLAPAPDTSRAVLLEAGRDVLDDDELLAVRDAIPRAFVDEVRAQGGSPVDARARIDHCRVRAGAGRRHTVYRAKCRASLVRGEVALAVVEAEVVRRVRSRAASDDEIAAAKSGKRNPLLERDDTEAALTDAARAAARRLVAPRAARQGELHHDDELVLDDVVGRRVSTARLARAVRPEERAAALVDLARYGVTDDGAVVAPYIDDAHPLVRRAALMAVAELGDTRAIGAVSARATGDDDEDVRNEAHDALSLLCALDERPLFLEARDQEPSARSSNSSGAGAGVFGEIDDADKNSSTWRQNAACSKR